MAMFMRSQIKGKVDSHLCRQIMDEMANWKNVLKRVVAVIKKLSSRGLENIMKNLALCTMRLL